MTTRVFELQKVASDSNNFDFLSAILAFKHLVWEFLDIISRKKFKRGV